MHGFRMSLGFSLPSLSKKVRSIHQGVFDRDMIQEVLVQSRGTRMHLSIRLTEDLLTLLDARISLVGVNLVHLGGRMEPILPYFIM
jgi:hypothetical protein